MTKPSHTTLGIGLTIFATAGMAALAGRHTPQQHLSHAMTVSLPFIGFILFGSIFAFIFGGTTRVDAQGIRASRLGVTRRFFPWEEVHGVAVAKSHVGRGSIAVKVALKDGTVYELLAPVATSPGSVVVEPMRHFEAASQAIIGYCHTAVPASRAVTADEIEMMQRAYARAQRERGRERKRTGNGGGDPHDSQLP